MMAVQVTKLQKEFVWRIYCGQKTWGLTTPKRRHQSLQALFRKGLITANDELTEAGIEYAKRIR